MGSREERMPWKAWGFLLFPIVFRSVLTISTPKTVYIASTSIQEDDISQKALISAVNYINKNPSLLPATDIQLITNTTTSIKENLFEYVLSLSQHDIIALIVNSRPEPTLDILGSMLHVPMVTMHEVHDHYPGNATLPPYSACLGPSGHEVRWAMIDIIKKNEWTDILVIYDVRWRSQANEFISVLPSNSKYSKLALEVDEEMRLCIDTKRQLSGLHNAPVQAIALFCDSHLVASVMDQGSTMEEAPQITEEVLNRVLYGNQLYSSFSYKDYVYSNCTTYLPVQDGYAAPPGKLDDSVGNPPNVPFRLQLPSKPLPNGLRIAGVSHGWTYRYGVFCTDKPIKSGTRFGPFNGIVLRKDDLDESEDNVGMWEVFLEDGTLSHYIDSLRSPENWMKFVRCAHHADEQNTNLVQRGSKLYYETSRDINEGEELLVWYGDGYEMTMGLPVKLRGKEQNQQNNLTNGPSYPCERCGKLFAYDYYRDKHLKYTRCLDKGDRRFPCSLCDRSFDKRDRLRIHVLHVHEKHRPHQCTVCDKRFSQSSSLNKHMRVHSGERPYRCPHCEKAFTASSILRTHIRQHSGEKPFKCKHCGRAFASHAAHDSHVRRTHLRPKAWACEFCGLSFSDLKQLHFHRTVHGQERAFSCEWCHREFQSKFLRDIHQNSFECLVGERIPTSPMVS